MEPNKGGILIGDWTSDFYLQSLYSDAKAVDKMMLSNYIRLW